jgi:penicillin-binding protein 1C
MSQDRPPAVARTLRRLPAASRVIIFILLAGALATAGVDYFVRRTPLPDALDKPTPATPVIVDFRGRSLAVLATPSARESYPERLRDLGEWLPRATVGVEDRRFWSHPGVDLRATAGTLLRSMQRGRIVSGASTITQQLIKMSSGNPARTFPAKLREALVALRLERDWDKSKILEAYLNRLDYGNQRIGPAAAAKAYFGKPAHQLSLAEAIFLAGLPQSPSRLNPWKNPDAALERYRRNVRRLAKSGLLPAGVTAESLLRNPPRVGKYHPPNEAPHFVSLIRQQVQPDVNGGGGGEKIVTSLDLDLQRLAARILREHLAAAAALGASDAALVVIENSSGAIRALACAGNASRASINSATEPRSCGSTLKPFLYLALLDQRKMTAASLLPDNPDAISQAYRDYDPQNYAKRYFGVVRVREALGNSLNVPAVFALSRNGARETFDYLKTWGFHFPESFDSYGAGFILGNAPVRLVELAGAYAALARGGEFWAPSLTAKNPRETRRLASPEACAIIADILSDNRARTASFGPSSPLNLPKRTAVKTGTSSRFRDGWCVGFNRDHTVAVWAGTLDGRPMPELLAVRSAAPVWAAMMRSLYAAGDQPWPNLEESSSLHAKDVAAETGLLPRPNEPAVREWFLPGTEPVAQASQMSVDGILRWPSEYHTWSAGPQNAVGPAVQPEALKILFPKDGATFSYNPAMSSAQQMLPLQSSSPECEWFLNGKKIEQPMVPLERGAWTVSAKARGQVAVANYLVE